MIVYRGFCIKSTRTPTCADPLKSFFAATLMADGTGPDCYLCEWPMTLIEAERLIDGYILGKLDGLAAGKVLTAEAQESMSPCFIPEAELPE